MATPKVEQEPELKLPTNDTEARDFERLHVHTVYNEIADSFSQTRHSIWPGVGRFIASMDQYAFMLDVGCGNGKYLNVRNDLITFGCDYSDQLIRICQERSFNCFVCDCLRIPTHEDTFDYVICIAVIHHLSTFERRVQALREMLRVLKKGGRALVTVWAKEQKYKEKESFYISKKKTVNDDATSIVNSTDVDTKASNVRQFGQEFNKQDVFVTWNRKKPAKKKSEEDVETSRGANDDNKVFLRFYHVFENAELEDLFHSIENVRIIESYYEQGNWGVIFEKIS